MKKGYKEAEEGFYRFPFIINTVFVSKIFAVLVILQKYIMVTWFDLGSYFSVDWTTGLTHFWFLHMLWLV